MSLDECDSQLLHAKLDYYAQPCCFIIQQLGLLYPWNLAQIEYCTDIVCLLARSGGLPAALATSIRQACQ